MAVSYRTQKCTSCASTKLEYDKETKLWHCMYCGAVIERHEEADSLFTIKNVIRQTLMDIAYVRMDSARSNLVEAEKIDSKYIGTVIASAAYEMNMLIHGDLNDSEKKNMMAQLKKNYLTLAATGEKPTDEELALYEFFDASEAIGVLILVFDSLGAAPRRDALFDFFTPEEVYSQPLNNNLVNFAVNSGKFDLFDKIVSNTANIDVKSVISIVLSQYPDDQNKIGNIRMLLSADETYTEEDINVFASYLDTTSDSAAVKAGIAKALLEKEIYPPISNLMKNVISQMSDPAEVSSLIDLITKKHLYEPEVNALVDFATQSCTDDVCCLIFERLLETKQFVVLTQNHFSVILRRSGNVQDKIRILSAALRFPVNDKVRNSIVGDYLCSGKDTPENRQQMLQYLLSNVNSISTQVVEKYLLSVTFDNENKADILKTLFATGLNKAFFRNSLSSYLQQSPDTEAVTAAVVDVLTGEGLFASPSAVIDILLKHRFQSQFTITLLRRLKANGLQYSDIFDAYITSVQANCFDSAVFQELLSAQTKVSDNAVIRYILYLRDYSAAKVAASAKMLSLTYGGADRINCCVFFNNEKVYCNLVQGYLLAAPDDEATALSVFAAMPKDKNAINAEVNGSGSAKKFKKYVAANRNALRPVSVRLCSEAGVL